MATVTLQYESARQAQQLFDNNPANLRLLQEELEIQATSRDGWIKLEGDDDNLAQAQDVFASLKDQLDTGQRPRRLCRHNGCSRAQDRGTGSARESAGLVGCESGDEFLSQNRG